MTFPEVLFMSAIAAGVMRMVIWRENVPMSLIVIGITMLVFTHAVWFAVWYLAIVLVGELLLWLSHLGATWRKRGWPR